MQVPQNIIENFRELIIENSEDLSKDEEQFILNYLLFMIRMNVGQTYTDQNSTTDSQFLSSQIILLSKIYHHSLKTGCEVIFTETPKFEYNGIDKTIGSVEFSKSVNRTLMEDNPDYIETTETELLNEYWDMIKVEMSCSERMYIYLLCQSLSVMSEATFSPKIMLRGRINFDSVKTKELFHVPSGEYFPLSELTKEGDETNLIWIDKNGNRYSDEDMLDKKRIKKLILEKKYQIDKINIDITKYQNIIESFDSVSIKIDDVYTVDKKIKNLI